MSLNSPLSPVAVLPANPLAEVKKYRFDEETIQKLLEMEWWSASPEEIDKVKELELRVGEYINPSVPPSNASISVSISTRITA